LLSRINFIISIPSLYASIFKPLSRQITGKVKGFKGFIMTGSLDDPQKAVNVSLWESREDMDGYYANNKEHASFLESLKPLIEQEIEKSDYTVFKLNFVK
jgi:heme-degrading monooxygenase HmoA